MPSPDHNILSLKGEIMEILDQKDSRKIRIICRPDWIILDLDRNEGYHLNDKVHITGRLEVRELYKLDMEKESII